MFVDTTDCDADDARPRRILTIDTAAAIWAEVARVDIAALGSHGVVFRFAMKLHTVRFEKRKRHVATTGRPLAILAVALCHARRFVVNGVGYGTT